MMQLFEFTRREANTEAGKGQLEFEKTIAMMDAYGGMYRSVNKGQDFSRLEITPRFELQYHFSKYEDYNEDEG